MAARAQFRSGLERRIAQNLRGHGVRFDYEPFRIPYVQPEKIRHYTPDFVLPNAIIVEAKGLWDTADRQKFTMIAACYPDLDIRFVFSRSRQTISKRSNTTYADYCETHGWQYADGEIPLAWIQEPRNSQSARTLREIIRTIKKK